jgi:hypothetical protein
MSDSKWVSGLLMLEASRKLVIVRAFSSGRVIPFIIVVIVCPVVCLLLYAANVCPEQAT